LCLKDDYFGIRLFSCPIGGGCVSGITELAKMLKERGNSSGYSPAIGTIIELPNLKVRLGDKIILTFVHIKSCVDLMQTDDLGTYINLGKEVVLLPFADGQKFILIGVVR
jgi:hypothetical protein